MNLAVVGSRTFSDYEELKIILDEIKNFFHFDTIVHGGAKGADSLAKRYAKERHLTEIVHYPEWEKYGKAAGFIRNEFIWKDAHLGVAFWDGQSKGTAHSFKIAKSQKKKLLVFNFIEKDFYSLINK